MENIKAQLKAQLSPQLNASIYGVIGRGVSSVRLNDNGELIFIMSDGAEVNLGRLPEPSIPTATADVLGGIKVGDNLKITDGVLSVDTAAKVEQDNTKPVTSGAVHMEIGNIEVLLKAL